MTLANAADVELEPIWAALLAKALEGKNVKELLLNVGSGGGGPAAAVVGGATGGAPATEAEKEEEKKEEEKEESDDDMVRSFPFTRSDFCLTGHLSRVSDFSINPLEPCTDVLPPECNCIYTYPLAYDTIVSWLAFCTA